MFTNISTELNVANNVHLVDPDTFPVIEWRGLRVVTTETLASGYGCEEKSIRMNLSRNLERFEEGKHSLADIETQSVENAKQQLKDLVGGF